MKIGRLYKSSNEQFVTAVRYKLLGEAPVSLWGELVPIEHGCIIDGLDYTFELDDNRKIKCNLKKRINVGVVGIPSRFAYRFVGS